MGRSWSGSIDIDGVAYLRKKKRGVILTWVLNLKKHSCTATWNHVLVLLQLLLLLLAQFASTTIICDLCLPTFPAAFMHQA